MRIELNSAQRDVLRGLVDEAIREIGPELHHTIVRSYRDDLRELRQNLWTLRGLLVETSPSGAEVQESRHPELLGSP